MSYVRRFDHVGITVADLDVVTAFFVALGLEVEGRAFVEGEFLEKVCGIPDSRTEIVMLKSPDDGARLELASFVRPDSVPGSPAAMANELGLRNVSFARAMDLSVASASTRVLGGWPTSGDRKGSSSRSLSASADVSRGPGRAAGTGRQLSVATFDRRREPSAWRECSLAVARASRARHYGLPRKRGKTGRFLRRAAAPSGC